MEPRRGGAMGRLAQSAWAAAGEALRDSALNLDALDRSHVAVNIGTSLGGTANVEEQIQSFMAKGRRRVDAFYLPTFIYNMAACHVSISYELNGPTTAPVLACAARN